MQALAESREADVMCSALPAILTLKLCPVESLVPAVGSRAVINVEFTRKPPPRAEDTVYVIDVHIGEGAPTAQPSVDQGSGH